MERRNLIIIGIALLVGLLAVYLVNSWFTGVEERQQAATPSGEMVQIAVARQNLDFGTALTRENTRMVAWPEQSVPPGAFRQLGNIANSGRVAIRPILAGEPILRERISDRAVLSKNIPDDLRAITVPVNEVNGVAGFVTPGDVVDVFLTRQIPGAERGGDDRMTTVVLENVQVLAIDRKSSERNTEPAVADSATLLVTQLDAQKLTLASQIGRLTLALRNVENQLVGFPEVVTPRDLGGAGVFAYSAPPAQAVAATSQQAQPAPPRRRGPTMEVYRGVQSTDYQVERYGQN